MAMYESKTVEFDGLIATINPAPEAFSVTLKQASGSAVTLKRGTLLDKSSKTGKYVIHGTAAADGEQKFSGDGSAKTFVVTAKPAVLKSLKVGTSDATGYTYDATTGTITFGTAPAAGTNNVVATYVDEVLTANAILCDDTEVGTSADVKAVAYRTGHFVEGKLIVATGASISAADKETLRGLGVLLSDAVAM